MVLDYLWPKFPGFSLTRALADTLAESSLEQRYLQKVESGYSTVVAR